MVRDAVKSLREPVAWILVSAVFVQFAVGLWQLLDKPDSETQSEGWFIENAYYGTSSFVGISIAVMLAAAVVLVALLPERLPRAKPILLIVAIEGGVLMLFGILTMFLGLFHEEVSSVTGESYGPTAAEKAQSFISSVPDLALVLLPMLLALGALRAPGAQPPGLQMPGDQFAPGMPPQPYAPQPYPPQQGYPQGPGYPGTYPQWGAGQPPQQGGYGGWPQ